MPTTNLVDHPCINTTFNNSSNYNNSNKHFYRINFIKLPPFPYHNITFNMVIIIITNSIINSILISPLIIKCCTLKTRI